MEDPGAVLVQLEQAAQIITGPPNLVTPERRQAAENVFLSFRKLSMPYSTCRHILETSTNECVLFHMASTLKEAVVREWSLLQPSDVESLRTYLLQYVTQHTSLQNFLREQLLQAVAVIFKRSTIDERYANREALFSDVTQLIASGSHSMQLIACSILSALLNEYSTINRSSTLGLPWEIHCTCKVKFEKNDLKKVFLFCLQVLQEMEKLPHPLDRDVLAIFNRFLSITEQVLCWEFIEYIPRRLISTVLSNQSVSFKPPASWRDVVLDKAIVHLLLRIHQKIRYNSEMVHHSLMCLSQLASMNGPIFADREMRTTFLTNFMEAFLQMLISTQLQDYEALGISNIISNLTTFFPTTIFLSLPGDVLPSFLQTLVKMTCSYCQAASQEDTLQKDDTVFLEAFEKMLIAWTVFISNHTDMPEGVMQRHAVDIYNTYLQCHLSPPDGTRNQVADGFVADLEDEYEELTEDDRDRYKDQLCTIGLFGRLICSHAVPLLTRLLEDRVNRLQGQLQRIQQCLIKSPGGTTGEIDHQVLNNINEDLHWLLLLICNLLTDEAEGETPMIPTDLMQYSIAQDDIVDLSQTVRLLTSGPTGDSTDTHTGGATVDTLVRLMCVVFRLCDLEKTSIDSALTHYLSPQVSQTLVWFLARWVPAYLLPNETYYLQVSKSLNTAFGRDTEGGQWTISFLLNKVLSNTEAWLSEPKLLEDTLELFLSMVDKKDRCDYVVKCDNLWNLVRSFSTRQDQFLSLPSSVKRLLCKGLVLAGSSAMAAAREDDYWKLQVHTTRSVDGEVRLSFTADKPAEPKPCIPDLLTSDLTPELTSDPGVRMLWETLHPIRSHYQSIVHQDSFPRLATDSGTRTKLLSLLQCYIGVSEGSRIDNVPVLFHFLQEALSDSVKVLDVFHSYAEVVQLVLELFDSVVNRQICYLSQADTRQLYERCLAMIRVYARHTGHIHRPSKEAEEDRYEDILTLMQLLTNTLSKDFIDFGDKDPEDGAAVSAADVVVYGLGIIIPLMTQELLKFPALCKSYMRLLTYIAEIYPEKICGLDEVLLTAVLNSEEMGLMYVGADIVKLSLEFLLSVASHSHRQQLPASLIHTSMAHFLELLFKMLLFENFDMELLETASTTYFALICCHHERYRQLVSSVLERQTDPAIHSRLTNAFFKLLDNVLLQIDRQNKMKFHMKFDVFLLEVRGLLCV